VDVSVISIRNPSRLPVSKLRKLLPKRPSSAK